MERVKFSVDFIVELDPTDILSPFSLETIANAIEAHGYSVDPIQGKSMALYISKIPLFTPEEEKEIEDFLETNKNLMNDLAKIEEKEKIDKNS